MKPIISILTIIFASFSFAQIIIGDNVGTAANKTSVLLEYANGQDKGIILPYVTSLPTGPNLAEGTFVLDATDPTKAKVKYYVGGGTWVDLSDGSEANVSAIMSSQTGTYTENPNAKVVIGAPSSSADGILVLESTTKAMVLPMVDDVNDIRKPSPGMMVYVNSPGAKRLAVYNGYQWVLWKPNN